MSKLFPLITIGTVIGAISIGASGCRRNSPDVEGPPDTSTYRPLPTPATEFEQKLKDVTDAHFQFVWVFRRLDGKEFTSEDSAILRTNAPRVVDWIGLDDKKTYIAGSNFPIAPQNLAALQKRYKIEDYSQK
ncbi:MAG TPA: hypothetical protein VFZ40_03670 [Pyrinomonadaceae bacterium]